MADNTTDSVDIYEIIRTKISDAVYDTLSDYDMNGAVKSALEDIFRYRKVQFTLDDYINDMLLKEVQRQVEEKRDQIVAAIESNRQAIEYIINKEIEEKLMTIDSKVINITEEIVSHLQLSQRKD